MILVQRANGPFDDGREVTAPEGTMLTRAWTGRLGRAIASDYTRAWELPGAPRPARYPIQRGLSSALRESGTTAGDIHRMQAWAGQSAAMTRAVPAGEVVKEMWELADGLLK